MKIVLIGNYVPDGQYSMLRYSEMLERMLTRLGHTVKVIRPPNVLGRLRLPGAGLVKWVRYGDKYLIAPFWLRWNCGDADLVHVCDHSNAMYLWCAGKKPRVITCHDLIGVKGALGKFESYRPGLTGRLLQRWILKSLRRARYVICDSYRTESDLREVAPGMKALFKVIYLALNRNYSPLPAEQIRPILAELGIEYDAEYLLHVGGNTWYKNRAGAIRIFSELRKFTEFSRTRLVFATRPLTSELRELCRSLGIEDCIAEMENLSDEALRALYSGAKALLFPSLIEGFGWPILEAQACGCPVITANRAPMTEVAGDAAILIDPEKPEAAARIIRDQWYPLAELRKAGFRNLERFSETRVADAYCEAYDEAIRQ
jgi:glycosyltransferase involved in cell wall biosynthesis